MITNATNDFWESKHNLKELWWISGTDFNIFLKEHNLLRESFIHKKILEIGVGTGSMTSQLVQLSNEVFCCDISKKALENLDHLPVQKFLTENLNQIPPVDIAFSHLVFQHCTDDEVLRIIDSVKLNDNGFFSFEFISFVDNLIIDKVQKLINDKTHFFRSIKDLELMIEQTNKKIIKIENPRFHKKWQFESNFIKVANR